jgi:hypothetical protein
MVGTKIKYLPKGLRIGGDLNVSSHLQKLPDNLYVGNNLSLKHTKLRKLAKGLHVENTLDLTNMKIKELPDDLYVGGCLILLGSQIKKIKKSLMNNIKGHIFKDSSIVVYD